MWRRRCSARRSIVYRAQLDGVKTTVEIYKTQMDAARVQADISRLALEAFQSQVAAYTSQVQAKVAEFGMYRAQIEGETAKVQAYEAQVRAYDGQIQGAKIRSDIQLGKLQSETEQARVKLAGYQGQLDQYKADVQRQVESGRLQVEYFGALTSGANMLNQAYLGKANLQQEVLKSTTQQNIQISEMTIQAARAKLEATVEALKFKTEGVHYGSEKFFALLTTLLGAISTLSVSTQSS